MLEVDERAPTFKLQDQDGNTVSLSDFMGQYIALYFYPKANTPGCRKEAQGFKDHYDTFAKHDIAIIGISADPVDELKSFAEENDLPFTLLSDENGSVATKYESFGEREVRDETWEIAFRNTYVINPEGFIQTTYEDVSPDDHPQKVLEDLKK